MALHEPAPAVPDRLAGAAAVVVHPRQAELVDVRAHEPEHRRQQGDRGQRRCTATTAAAPMPSPLMNDRPMASMPSRAMITVRPANSTARPDVSTAVTTASSGSSPACRPWR